MALENLDLPTIAIIADQGNVVINNNSSISVSNEGRGYAGDIFINAGNEVSLLDNSEVIANGDWGIISIGQSGFLDPPNPPQRVMLDDSQLTARNSGGGG